MSNELATIMAHATHTGFITALSDNVTGKATKFNEVKTNSFLRKLYVFNPDEASFNSFQYFWNQISSDSRPLLALIYAMGRDFLLRESLDIISEVPLGERATVDLFIANIQKHHPGKYSDATCRSTAQNIASSWKQAGFLEGKIKNLRAKPQLSSAIIAFALVLAYLSGLRGEQLLESLWMNALMLQEDEKRSLIHRAAVDGYLHYQYSGTITVIDFKELFQMLNIYGS